MFTPEAQETIYNLRNASINHYPFPHFYIQNVFPKPLYRFLRNSLPPSGEYSTKGTSYHGRQFAEPTTPLLDFMRTEEFAIHICSIFLPQILKRRKETETPSKITHELRFVRDREKYQIGPHTDTPRKLVSLLFYLPPDAFMQDLGTSISLHNDPKFYCNSGTHHPFDNFTKIYTAPFLPNSCFGFFRTSQSFHGVSPITIPCKRDVLLYNLYDAAI